MKTLADVVELQATTAYYDDLDTFVAARDEDSAESVLAAKLTIRLSQKYHVSQRAMEIRMKNWPLGIYGRIRAALSHGLRELP